MQQETLWRSVSKPRGGFVDKCNKGIVRALWVSRQYSYRDDEYRRKDVNCRNMCATNANCDILPTSAGVKGHMLDAMTATIVTVSMANANNNNNNKCKQQQKNKAIVTRMPRITRATFAGQAANQVTWQSRWHRLQWWKNKRKRQQQSLPFCWYSKNKEDACCSMLWPSHSNIKLSPKRKNNVEWLPMTRTPRLVARLTNLA